MSGCFNHDFSLCQARIDLVLNIPGIPASLGTQQLATASVLLPWMLDLQTEASLPCIHSGTTVLDRQF